MSQTQTTTRAPLALNLLLVLGGAIGWFASFELLTEYLKVVVNPEYVPNCSFSVLVTCTPNMSSWQGSLFGFSNTIIGVAAFVAPIAVGVAGLAGARFAPWFWSLFNLGLLGGWVFVTWLQYESIFSLHTLCPWCMVVWSVMIPMFWTTTGWNARAGAFGTGLRGAGAGLLSWAWVIVLLNYLVIAVAAELRLDYLNLHLF